MSFIDIDDELADHLDFALLHLQFARDFMWRTGMKNEFQNEGWAYGRDWNGTDELIQSQFMTITKLLMPEITTDVMQLSISESEEFSEMIFDFAIDEKTFSDDFIYVVTFIGPDEELKKWSSFLKMVLPDSQIGYWQDSHWSEGQAPRPHFLWLIAEEQVIYMDAFAAMVSVWEVKTYYDNIANQCAWRTLRGSVDACPEGEPVA